jgi:hypothetical protein
LPLYVEKYCLVFTHESASAGPWTVCIALRSIGFARCAEDVHAGPYAGRKLLRLPP